MADEKIRIIDLQELSEVTADAYVAVDNAAGGTKKLNVKSLYDSVGDAVEQAQSDVSQAISGMRDDFDVDEAARGEAFEAGMSRWDEEVAHLSEIFYIDSDGDVCQKEESDD